MVAERGQINKKVCKLLHNLSTKRFIHVKVKADNQTDHLPFYMFSYHNYLLFFLRFSMADTEFDYL